MKKAFSAAIITAAAATATVSAAAMTAAAAAVTAEIVTAGVAQAGEDDSTSSGVGQTGALKLVDLGDIGRTIFGTGANLF